MKKFDILVESILSEKKYEVEIDSISDSQTASEIFKDMFRGMGKQADETLFTFKDEDSAESFKAELENVGIAITESVLNEGLGKILKALKDGLNNFLGILSGDWVADEGDNAIANPSNKLRGILNKLSKVDGKKMGVIDLKKAPDVIKAIKRLKSVLTDDEIETLKKEAWNDELVKAWDKFEDKSDYMFIESVRPKYFIKSLETGIPADRQDAIDYFHKASPRDQKLLLQVLDDEFREEFAEKLKKELNV